MLEHIKLLIEHALDEIDAYRASVLAVCRHYAEDEDERAELLAGVPDSLKELNENIHGPLMVKIAEDFAEDLELKDKTFCHRMQQGFNLIGNMEPCCFNEVLMEMPKTFEQDMSEDGEFRSARGDFNAMILSKIKETDYVGDLMQIMQEVWLKAWLL